MKVINRKARFDYEIQDKFEAGIALTGAEVKSIKKGQLKLDDAYVRIDPNLEVFLVNAHVSPYQFADNKNYNPTRSRKLLLHKKEILSLQKKTEARNLTLVPTACYLKKRRIKIEIGLGKGKKKYDKRQVIRKRDLDREMRRDLRGKNY
ncbi:SsrA-binding protein [Candidatus Beckwithbacteria bacterium CG10_big_fil_rev_8_21_14_0_10_34_10]|uniref:SsrA-binding protein n=1 Tax=Candidatus Beckwithbacteria bacterium CG10_big_fil_rev_8_21_14_0_10_34_10 TaxID=1974495 RepID=A0A2H0WBD3_9BACT|nr:MAG: SsrA-binding protein [Candidatus Beckwithbacteria bacterium CG10_big_fil_rev_8_21_14_0_10_34_10]